MYYDLNHPDARRLEVLLDGEPQGDCCIADDEAGYIVRYKRNAEGRHMPAVFLRDSQLGVTPIIGDCVVEVLTGKVEVRLLDGAGAPRGMGPRATPIGRERN